MTVVGGVERCAVLLLAGALLGGCIVPVPVPGKEEVSPEFRGRVLDSESGQPIEGVRVAVLGLRDAETFTDADGAFVLPEKHKRFLIRFLTPCPEYHFPPVGKKAHGLAFSHPDYEPFTYTGGRLREIRMNRKSTAPSAGPAPAS